MIDRIRRTLSVKLKSASVIAVESPGCNHGSRKAAICLRTVGVVMVVGRFVYF